MNKQIKLFEPTIGPEEEVALKNTLRSKFWASGAGVGKVEKFEKILQKYVNAKECVTVNSGTAALHLALSLFDIKNKEVILPSLSFVTTAHAVMYNGGKPVFADVDSRTLCIDHQKIEQLITKKTKVILPVHFGGMPCNLVEIIKLCKKYNLKLVEDAAHAVGTTYNGKKIGSHGNAVCFSFHPVKNLAMPTGGAITLNGKSTNQFKAKLKTRRWCGISNRIGVKYDVNELGWNFYMNEFSAAIGIEQIKKLEGFNRKRKNIAKRYANELLIENKMQFDKNCSYHLYWIKVKNRTKFMKFMNKQQIETGIHYLPIHKMKYYSSRKTLPVTEESSKQIVSIPIYPTLTDNDVTRIIKTINKFSNYS